MPTSPVVAVVSGATFSVTVTPANLDTVLSIRDFVVLENGTLTINPLSYTKATATSITYAGPALAANTNLEIRRNTPRTQRVTVLPNTKVRAIDWNQEFDRRVRIQEEVDLYGAGGGFTVRVPLNDAYGVTWATDTVFGPTRKALYDKMETFIGTNSPAFTGVPTAPTAATNNNTTQLATTAYVQSNLGGLAPLASPAFTGNPTASTQLVSDSSTRLATTAYVKNQLYATLDAPTFTGNVIIPTVVTTDNSTLAASTAHVKANLANYTTTALLTATYAPLASPAFTGNPTAPTAALGDNDTSVATTAFVQQSGRPLLIASRITSTIATTASVENPIVFNNAIRDVDGILNTATGVITLPRVGYYDISALVFYSGAATFGSLSIIQGGSLTRLVRMDFRGNVASAIVFNGSTLFYNSVANTQIRLSVSDLSVAGTVTNEANATGRNATWVTVAYLGNDA